MADKAAGRAVAYRRAIAGLQAAERDRDALAEALRWLRSESTHVEHRRPRDARVLYAQLTGQVAGLARFIAGPDGTGLAGKSARRAERRSQAIAGFQAAGRGRDALAEAVLWLQSEAAAAARGHMQDAPAMYSQLTDRIVTLAAEIPSFRPAAGSRRGHH